MTEKPDTSVAMKAADSFHSSYAHPSTVHAGQAFVAVNEQRAAEFEARGYAKRVAAKKAEEPQNKAEAAPPNKAAPEPDNKTDDGPVRLADPAAGAKLAVKTRGKAPK